MLIKAFLEQVRKNPNNIAVKTKEKEITYDFLDKQADCVARQIIDRCRRCIGERENRVAALLFEHGADMIVSTIGALKANMIYVPFDPSYPESRLLYMLEDSQAFLIVTNSNNYELARRLAAQTNSDISILNVDLIEQSISAEALCRDYSENGIAYILYTSGSTGRPKGVVQTHKNVLHFARSYILRLGITENDRMTLFSAFSHDAAIVDIFSGILSGAALYPLNVRQQINIEDLADWLVEEEITIWHSVPTLYRYFANTLTDNKKFLKLRYVVLGGENVLKQDVVKFREVFENTVLVNLYGQSESSINSLQFIVSGEKFEGISLGEPIDEVKILVINKDGKKAAALREGELVIASPYLALGYWREAEKTEKSFVNDPDFGRIYKTGDLGWVTERGKLEYLGRKDFQIKIRGFRVEAEEVENSLLKHELIKEAAVIGRDDINGDKVLHAYIVSDKSITLGEIRNHLSKGLPDYMIPSYFTILDKMPLTPTGKIDRIALKDIKRNMTTEAEYEEPKTETEKKLVNIWREILGVEKIGINDSFFELGGHSLKATNLVAKIHKELNAEIPLKVVFTSPTIKGLAEYINGADTNIYLSIQKAEEKEYYPLSSAQKKLYTLQQLETNSISYNLPGVMILEGDVDKNKLEDAFVKLIRRHEALRTSFEFIEDRIVQKINKDIDFHIEYIEADEDEAKKITSNFIRPFDLSKAPLLRVGLIRICSNNIAFIQKHILMFDMHHIISDGTSMTILSEEFLKLYEDKDLPALRIQYKDYASWQEELFRTEKLKETEEYWLKLFEGDIPVLNIMTDYPRPQIQSQEGDNYYFKLEEELLSELKGLAVKNEATLFIILLEILSITLSKYTGQEDLVVGTVTAGRKNDDLEKLIGVFINNIALRCLPQEEKTAIQYLKELKERVIEAYENQDYPIEELINKLNIPKDMSRNSLFDVMLILQNYDRQKARTEESKLIIKPYPQEYKISDYDMTLYAFEENKELIVKLQYCTKLFKRETIERFAKHFRKISWELVRNTEKKLKDIDMLSEEEKYTVIKEFNNAREEYPKHKTINELFEEQVRKTPDNIAAVYEDKALTYSELNKRANGLARILRAKGVGRDSIVGIMVEKSLEMIIGIMAILKSGGAYLPIDPEYPPERVAYMLEDSGVNILLIQSWLRKNVKFIGEIIDVGDGNLYDEDCSSLEAINKPDDLAYVIYTSGTTGRPKGILTRHRNVIAYTFAFNRMFNLNSKDATLQQASFTFDGLVEEVYTMLFGGGKIVIPKGIDVKEVKTLSKAIIKNNVTILSCSPLILSEFNNDTIIDCVHTFLSSSDVLRKEYYSNIVNYSKVYNMYGPSETTVCTTCYECTKDGCFNIPIGKPISNARVYILDKHNHAEPIGVPGELCIAGDGLAKGYLNRPELTAEKFVENPFEPGERMYRTGDLARWLPDGNIEFLGRIDHQVKIRGYRIELGEIESQLLTYESIKEVIVLAKVDENGDKYLCAYIVADREVTASELRERLLKKLPEYMIPSYFIQLEKMPLNHNGKIDRKVLPEPDGNINTGIEYEAPGNEIQEKLAAIWQEILKVDRIGINDNFFAIGGHSLKATSLMARIRKDMNVEVPLRQIFVTPTIKGLSEYIKGLEENIYESIEKAEEAKYYELSSAQKRLYTLQQFEVEGTAYNTPGAMEIEGELDKERLEKAFNELIRRHESLRTSFEVTDEKIVQIVHEEIEFKVECKEAKEEEIEAIIKGFIKPFDLSRAPLLRVGLIKLQPKRHILLYDMHHIISDGTSMGILTREFARLYKGEEIPKLRIQYKDYAAWQNELFRNGEIKKQEEYWIDRYKGEVPSLNMPTDYPRPSVQSFEGNRMSFEFDREMAKELKKIEKETGTTLYMVLLSAYNVLLSKYSGQEDIVVGTPIAGRPHADLENIIGMFVNTLAIRNHPEGEKTVKELLEEVKLNALKAYENQDYQFEELVEKLDIRRDMSRNPLFDTMFVVHNMDMEELEVEGLSFRPYEYENKIAKFDLTMTAMEKEERIKLQIEYSTKLYKEETIERLKGHYINIVKEMIKRPDKKLKDIEMLDEEEKEQLLYGFNNTNGEYPKEKTIHELFEEQVERTPDNAALVYEGKELTYRELNEKANSLARLLREKGVGRDSIVGLMVERSFEMIIGIMAILKSGGAYLPIDPEYPKDRIEYMLSDSGTSILLTQSSLNKKIEFEGEAIYLEDDRIYEIESSKLESPIREDGLSYIIYTSGSTGKPKGVMIEHRNIVNFIKGITDKIDFNMKKTILSLTTICFDIFALESLLPLAKGLKIVIANEDQQKDAKLLNDLIIKESIDMIQITPSRMQLLISDQSNLLSLQNLKEIMIGGEAFPNTLLEDLRKASRAKIYNLYGPTETTVWSTLKEFIDSEEVTIGKPILNTQIYIVDRNNKLQPIGVVGELCIGGSGLARGYLNRLELTTEKFVPNPFKPGERMYRTGDLARWLPDGDIQLIGRKDNQVKIRGFRIELGEIESRLLGYESIKEVAAAAREDESGDKYICAYMVGDGELSVRELREYLLKELPDYMIPSYFMQLEKLPLTPNGKIDRKALPKPDGNITVGTEYEAPRNETEEKLVRIWSEVLGIEGNIGINDNFFELGGHSLKATYMSAKIHKELNAEVPLSQIFKVPTVKGLAEYIVNSEISAYAHKDDKIVLLKKGQNLTKHLFLIHAGSGEVGAYTKFCNNLNTDFNYWGIRADGLENYGPKNITLEEIAQKHIEKIKKIQPHGPYYFAGWCVGGYIAFEITRQLEQIGEEVKFVAFFNSFAPQNSVIEKCLSRIDRFSVKSELKFINEVVTDADAIKSLRNISKIDQIWEFFINYLEQKNIDCDSVKAKLNKISEKQFPNFNQLNTREFIYYTNLLRTLFRAHNIYIPVNKVKSQVHYFIANKTRRKNINRWDNYCYKPIKYHEVNGDHFSIFETSDAVQFSEIFNKALCD